MRLEVETLDWKSIFYNIADYLPVKTILSFIVLAFNWVFKDSSFEAVIVVYSLITIDTFTGFLVAFNGGSVSSSGFFRFASKLFIYLILMGTASLVDMSLPVALSMPIMYSFLAATEAISIMENLSVLGYPVPTKLIKSLKVMNKNHK